MKIRVLGPISRDEDGSWSAQFEYGMHKLDSGYDPNAVEPQVIRPHGSQGKPGLVSPWEVPEVTSAGGHKAEETRPRRMAFPWTESQDQIIEKYGIRSHEADKTEDNNNVWAYKGYSILLKAEGRFSRKINITDDLILEMKYAVVKHERRMSNLKRSVDRHIGLDASEQPKREHIADRIRIFVWQRDEGKCVKCGSIEKLEFDHIIPVAKGGNNTERNIQLLCEACNRSKGANI